MFFRKNSKRRDDNPSDSSLHDVNMTPLIDVSLVLVVMLILATPLAFESSIALRESQDTAKSGAQDTHGRIEITVVSNEIVEVNRTVISRSDVAAHIKPLIEEAATRMVVISCKDGVSHGAFVDVLDQAKLSGAPEIAVSGR